MTPDKYYGDMLSVSFAAFFVFVLGGGFEHLATIGIHWVDFDPSRNMDQTVSTEPLPKWWWAENGKT